MWNGSIIYTEIGSGKLIKAISRVVNLLNSMIMIHFSSINSISLLSDVWRLAVRRDEILFMLLPKLCNKQDLKDYSVLYCLGAAAEWLQHTIFANGMIENFPLKGFSSKESGKKRENLRLLKSKKVYISRERVYNLLA